MWRNEIQRILTRAALIVGFRYVYFDERIIEKYGFPNRLEDSWSFTAQPGEIRRNTQAIRRNAQAKTPQAKTPTRLCGEINRNREDITGFIKNRSAVGVDQTTLTAELMANECSSVN